MTTCSQFELVSILWDDAHKGEIENVHARTLDEIHQPFQLVSVGWLLRYDEKGATISPEQSEADEEDCRGYTFIPAGMIVRVTLLDEGVVLYERE